MSSLSSLSASNNCGKGHLFIVFKMYFDGSGKDDGIAPRLTLAGYAGRAVHWEMFDREWNQILSRHQPRPAYMHMNEAFRFRKAFQQSDGWTKEKVINLARTLNEFLAGLSRDQFCAFRYTVDMDAYRMWRKLDGLRPASEQCALDAFGKAFDWCSGCRDLTILQNVDVFYDRGEAFLKHMHARWTSRDTRQRFPEMHLINTVAPADSHKTPALQAADMLAWSANRLWVGPRDDEIDTLCESVLTQSLGTWHCEYDERYLQERRGLIRFPGARPAYEGNPVAYIKEHRKPPGDISDGSKTLERR